MKQRSAAAAFACVLLLAACGGDSDGTANNSDPMPLSVGNRWVYEYNAGIYGSGTSTHEVVGTRSIDGRMAYVVRDDTVGGGDTPFVESETSLVRYPGSGARPHEIADGPLSILQLPIHPGDTWTGIDKTTEQSYDVDGDGIHEVEIVNFHSRVDPAQSVRTPLRTFDVAYPVVSHYQRQIVNPVTHEVYDTNFVNTSEFYVLGIGVVRREVSEQPYGQSRDYHGVEVLRSFEIKP